ncbi:MAG: metalloprotease TldD [Thiotrichaceae bacterium]|nr:metalloprotease TldD [Thiotrichaceae bacterium]
MTDPLRDAQATILDPAGLSINDFDAVFAKLNSSTIDLADIYFQVSRKESWALEDQIVKSGNYSISQGFGVRAVSGEQTGFAYSDEINLNALLESVTAARAISKSGTSHSVNIPSWKPQPNKHQLYTGTNPLNSIDEEAKIALLHFADKAARKHSTYVTQVIPSLSASYENILIVNNEGSLVADIRPMIHMGMSVIVEKEGERETANYSAGGRYDLNWLTEEKIEGYAHEAVRLALLKLNAKPSPAGEMDVVLGNGWPGVLLHEAVGHGLESDFNRKGTSVFSDRIGEKVASAGVTVVDDGAMQDRRGSLNVDDEGTPTQCTTLIDDGILVGYMHDKLNARLMNTVSTGNGRRQSYSHLPMPRMTNTYMRAGDHDPEEIIASMDKGLYAVNFGGGQVDITSGQFVFSSSEAYMVEKGKILYPVKGATLIGNGPQVMQQITMIGNDLALDPGIGVCGKAGQSVPVGVGQPTIKITNLTVGGTGS